MARFANDIDAPLVGAEILLGCDTAAEEVGIRIAPLLIKQGIPPSTLHNPVGYLRHSQVTRFLQDIETRCGIDHFGFVLGKHQPAMRRGPIGEIVMASPTLRTAIDNSILYQPLFSEGSTHELLVNDGMAQVSRWSLVDYPFPTTQMRLLGVTMMYRVLRALCGNDWQPMSVSCSFSAIRESRQISKHFGCQVVFDQERDAISFQERDLARPLRTADPEMMRLLQKHLDPLLAARRASDDLLDQAESYIRRTLGTRRCTMESCAKMLRVSSRSLQRHLAMHGTSFKHLLLSQRMELTRQYLRDSKLELSGLAELLGYSSQGAFTRAFKTRHDMAPIEWRKQHGKDNDE